MSRSYTIFINILYRPAFNFMPTLGISNIETIAITRIDGAEGWRIYIRARARLKRIAAMASDAARTLLHTSAECVFSA